MKSIEIANTTECDELQQTNEQARVVFPPNANILLSGDSLTSESIQAIDDFGEAVGRSLHLCSAF